MTEVKKLAIDLMDIGDKFNEKTLINMVRKLSNSAKIYDLDRIKEEINKISIFTSEIIKRSNNYD